MLFHNNNSKIANKDKKLSTSDLIGLGPVSSTPFKKHLPNQSDQILSGKSYLIRQQPLNPKQAD